MSNRQMTAARSLVLVGVCLFSAVAQAGDEAKKDLARLQGRWRIVSQENAKGGKKGGKMARPSAEPDMIVQGNKIIIPRENLVLPFTLDATKNPKRIKRTIRYALGGNKFKDVQYYSIYTFEGDRVKFCFFDYSVAQTTVPKAFPQPGKPSAEEVFVVVYERIKNEKK